MSYFILDNYDKMSYNFVGGICRTNIYGVMFMKRMFLLILGLLLAVLPLSGCSCDHEYNSTGIIEPTYETEGEETFTCSKCGDTYTVQIERRTQPVVPTSVLDAALSDAKYYASPFSISIGELVNSAMDNYQVEYLRGEDAIAKGYLSESDIDSSVDINYLYYAIISGDTMLNPDIPYMTEYEAEAVQVWMIFDENNNCQNSGVTLCNNLETCAMLLMSYSY